MMREATLALTGAQQLFRPASVGWISHDRVSEVRQVNPDLVGASGFEPHLEQAGHAEALAHPPVRPRGTSAAGDDRDALALPRVAAERGVDRPRFGARVAPHQGK